MGLFSFFEKIIGTSKPPSGESLDPNQLPTEIENDLRSKYKPQRSSPNPNNNSHHDGTQLFGEVKAFVENMLREPTHQDGSFLEEHYCQVPDAQLSHEQSLRDQMLNKHDPKDLVPYEDDEFTRFFHGASPMRMFERFFEFPAFKSDPFFGNEEDVMDDKDLDSDLLNGDQSLDDILNYDFTPPVTTAYKYSTRTTKLNADGTIETQSTKRDSEGNEKSILSRFLGDQSHTVTTNKSKDGVEEKVEDFVNMEEGDIKDFNDRWNKKREDSSSQPSDFDSSIFERFFPPWDRPKL